MSKAYKGGNFEREICRTLSKWWTHGKRDDVFWRSSQSGGRATLRFKKGKSTFGSYGDIAATDPIGGPLLKFATIELKRGSSHGTPWDLFESPITNAVRPFEAALHQARSSSKQAGSLGWMLIARRDRKAAILYMERDLCIRLGPFAIPCVRYRMQINRKDDFSETFYFYAFVLENWLRIVTPEEIIECARENELAENRIS